MADRGTPNRSPIIDDYMQALERENKAKSVEISLLYAQIKMLRSEQKTSPRPLNARSTNCEQCQTDEDPCHQEIKKSLEAAEDRIEKSAQQIEFLEEEVRAKREEIARYHSENEEMFEDIEKLEGELEKAKQENSSKDQTICVLLEKGQTVNGLKQKLQSERKKMLDEQEEMANERKIHQYQMLQMKGQIDRMARENNEYIETIRRLGKEKNAEHLQKSRLGRQANLNQIRKRKYSAMDAMNEQVARLQDENRQLEINLALDGAF